MEKLSLTQAELAGDIGVSAAQVSHLLAGRRRMRLDTFRRIDQALEKRERHAKARGVSENPQSDYVAKIAAASITADQARAQVEEYRRTGTRPRPRLTKAQANRMQKELKEIGETLKRAPVVCDLSEDELLGYDKMP